MEPRVLAHDSRGTGEPIVLVPGGLTGWLSWIPHQDRLAERYRAIRVQPIHNELGSEGQPGDPTYDFVTERESLRLTLDHLGLDAVHLAGWSGGGRAALEFVTEYPERVRSLALVEPATFWVLEQLGEWTEELATEEAFLRGLFGTAVTEDDLARFLVVAGFVEDEVEARSHPGWAGWVPHRMALSWQGEGLDRPDRTLDDLSRINATTILFKGTVTAAWEKRVVDVLADRLHDSTAVELEGDHACHIQSIDVFLETLEGHLRRAA